MSAPDRRGLLQRDHQSLSIRRQCQLLSVARSSVYRPPRPVAARRLDKYLTKRRAEEPGGLLFAMPDGSQIISLIDQLNSALREAGIERSSFGEKYSAYSLRHFYAVNALRNGVGVFEVARNMGTSVQMIQEYYGKQATSAVFATRLGD
jgi:integrase